MNRLTNKFLRILLLLAFISAIKTGMAQTDAQFSQYYEVPTYYNPAAIGQTDYLRIRGGARLQWVGIDNAPRSFLGTADMPLKLFGKRFGTGLVIGQESLGLYKTLNLNAQIGYKFKKFGGEFTAALGLGFYDQSWNGSDVVLPDDDDYHQGSDNAIPTQDLHGTAFDIAAGIWFRHKIFWTGLSMTHVNAPVVSLSSDSGSDSQGQNIYEFKTGRTLYFMGGGNIPIKYTLFEIMPSLMVKSDFTFTTAEITARCRYNKFLTFGLGYRYDDSIYATVSAEIKGIFLGYAYDYPTSAIAKASTGSHELFIGYSLKLNLGDKNRNRHKAIRIM